MTRSLAIGAVLAALGFAALHGSCSGKEAPAAVVEAASRGESESASKEEEGAGLRAQSQGSRSASSRSSGKLSSSNDVIRPRKPERTVPTGVVPTRTHASSASTMQSDLERIVREGKSKASQLSGGKSKGKVRVAVEVRHLDAGDPTTGGEVLATLNGRQSMRPASNMKLVTTAAALEGLGHEAEFETRFFAGGPIENGSLKGDLVVLAGGDPLYLAEAQGSVDAWLGPIAAHLHEKGIERIEGQIVLDESNFQDPAPAPGWPDASQHWDDYCALAGGFSANGGCISVAVSAGASAGSAGVVIVEPRDHGLEPRIDVKTGKKGSKLNVAVEGHRGRLVVRGSIPLGVKNWETRFSAGDPVELFGAALRGALKREGLALSSETIKRERGTADGLEELAVLASPIEWSLGPINTDSNNAVADQLFLKLGHDLGGEGTREGGNRAVRAALERLGVSTEGYQQVDGSGLSRENRISPTQVTALLHGTFERDLADGAIDGAWPALRASLAIGGETGTLSKRMRASAMRGRVHAKTGFIGGTSALSGAVETHAGSELLFSILVEYPRLSGLNTGAWKPMQDAICERLAAWRP